MPPLPAEKLKQVLTKRGNNTGILKVLNFNLKIFNVKEKIVRIKTQSLRDVDSILGVTLNKTESESSYINSELHRKIVAIKKKNGANFFHVRRYSGEPTMNPRNIERKYEES